MANAIKWEGAWTSRGNVLTTELNSLASAAYSAKGSEIDNSTNLDQYGKVEINVTFGTAPSAGGYLQMHMLTAPDGTNYEDGGGTTVPGGHTIVAVIPVRAVTTAQIVMSSVFPLQPAKTRFVLYDGAGVAFPSSGSTVELFSCNDEVQ